MYRNCGPKLPLRLIRSPARPRHECHFAGGDGEVVVLEHDFDGDAVGHVRLRVRLHNDPASHGSNFEVSVLGYVDEKLPCSIVYRSQLDEICLFVHRKLEVS